MRYSNIFVASLLTVLLSACGTLMKGQTQDVTLLTPGTSMARCTLDNGVRYVIETGQTFQIMRSGHDIKVDCYGLGNKHRTMLVESGFNNWSAANVANALIPGVTYDHLSKGLYEYPPTIVVDFTGVPASGFETPNYHNLEVQNPYALPLEDFSPSTPRLENDSVYMKRGVEKVDNVNSNPFAVTSPSSSGGDSVIRDGSGVVRGTTSSGGSSSSSGQGVTPMPSLKGGNAESLTRSANPTVFRN